MRRRLSWFSKGHVLLALVLGLAAWLRLHDLLLQGYWSDELFSAWASHPKRTAGEVYQLTVEDVHPPLYQVLLWINYKTFGYGELTGRLFSAVMGWVGIAAVYLLGKEVYGRRTGLYAALLASLNVFLVFYSQEVRSYALLGTLATFSYLYYLRLLHDPRWKTAIFYTLLTGLALHTHRFGIVLLATQVVMLVPYLIWASRERAKLLGLALVAGLVLAISLIPQLDYLLSDATGQGGWIPAPKADQFVHYLRLYFQSPWLTLIFSSFLLLAIRRLLSRSEERRTRELGTVLLSCIVLTYVIGVVVGLSLVPVLNTKNAITAILPLFVVLGSGLAAVQHDRLRKGLLAATVAISLIPLFIFSSAEGAGGHYVPGRKEDWSSFTRDFEARGSTAPAFAVKGLGEMLDVYHEWNGSELRTKPLNSILARLKQKKRTPAKFWIIGWSNRSRGSTQHDALIRQYHLEEVERVGSGRIVGILLTGPNSRPAR